MLSEINRTFCCSAVTIAQCRLASALNARQPQWNGFEAQVKTYFESAGKQVIA